MGTKGETVMKKKSYGAEVKTISDEEFKFPKNPLPIEEVEALIEKNRQNESDTSKISRATVVIYEYSSGKLQDALDMAAKLAEIFFDDSYEKYRTRRKNTHPFNRFCKENDLKALNLNKKTIQNYIRIHFISRKYPEGLWKNIPLGIHELLLSVKSDDKRIELFHEILKNDYKYSEVQAKVRLANEKPGDKDCGRSQIREIQESLKTVKKIVKKHLDRVLASDVKDGSIEEFQEYLLRLNAQLDAHNDNTETDNYLFPETKEKLAARQAIESPAQNIN